MTPPRVVVADPLAAGGLELLRSRLEVVLPANSDALRAAVPSSDALIVRSRTQVTSDLLNGAVRLRLIARAGIGVDNIDLDAATARGILVVNAPMGNVRSTAEHTLALIFALARRIPAADRAVRDGAWKDGYEGTQLAGKRLGVIGVGKIGREVAAMGAALGMQILAHDPYLPDSAWPALGLHPLPLEQLLADSDIVTIHVPLLAETRGMIGARQIAAMKPGAYLINCARGGLVDESALAAALVSGHLAGAALDVFAQEPLHDSPLLGAPNLILTPHVAASTREAQAQVSTDVAKAVLDYFAGKPPAFPVNPSVLGV
jgi:D-3-phosphoglycerate dehydrogenase